MKIYVAQYFLTVSKSLVSVLGTETLEVNSFSTRLLSSCTDEYAHTYDIST